MMEFRMDDNKISVVIDYQGAKDGQFTGNNINQGYKIA